MLEIFLSLYVESSLAQATLQNHGWMQIAQHQMTQHSDMESLSNSAEGIYRQGLRFHQEGQIDEAIQAYQETINLNPLFDAAYINLGLLFISIDQLEQADTLLQRVLELPDRAESPASIHSLAHYNLAIIRNRQGEPAAALEEVQQALTIAPDFSQAQQFLNQLQSP